jgi:uncharacterized protein YjbI with pentapeptide repeats
MGFKFRLGFRRDGAAGTAVATVEAPLEPAVSDSPAAAEVPADAAATNDSTAAVAAAETILAATPAPAPTLEATAAPVATATVEPPAIEPPPPVVEDSAAKSAAASAPAPAASPTPSPAVADFPAETPAAAEAPESEIEAAAILVTEHTRADSTNWALEEKLASHKEWLESQGVSGLKADLSRSQMEGAELIGVNLRFADFHDANLKEADLLLADLRDACLMRTNFEEACLVGSNLEGANLEGADLETAMGLVPRQLAGANLRAASLPPQIKEFSALEDYSRASRTALLLFSTTMALTLLSALMIWKTKDVQLIADSSVLPFLHSTAASAALPAGELYLIGPVLLIAVYLFFQFHLQRLWDAVLELPAVFPDGRVLGDKDPWIIRGLLRAHFRWMNEDAPSTRLVEKSVSIFLAYWIVPLTLLFFWGRYLTVQEMHGSALHVLLILAATAVAIYTTTRVGRPQIIWAITESRIHRILRSLNFLKPSTVTFALGGLLAFLSLGTVLGVPHDPGRVPQISAADIRRWAPTVFWSMGYEPYADLTEAAISTKPAGWTGADEQLGQVAGGRLNNAKFRYAQAYGIFLVNSHLWRSDFRGAFLSEADFRGADLGQADLRGAILDRAQMTHANLDRAQLDGANLTRADLRGVNLSYSSFQNAMMVDARLDGASLYSAHLGASNLLRANLQKTDFREAHLEGVNLEHADMQQAYLWSAKLNNAHLADAQLAGAIFIDAVLAGSDLHGALFQGTVLTNADLQDTNLDGADLRGALGLSARQVCSAKSRAAAQLDETLQTQVEAACGSIH